MAKRSIEIEREYRLYTKMSPEFVHLTGESLKQQIGGLENKVEKVSAKIFNSEIPAPSNEPIAIPESTKTKIGS